MSVTPAARAASHIVFMAAAAGFLSLCPARDTGMPALSSATRSAGTKSAGRAWRLSTRRRSPGSAAIVALTASRRPKKRSSFASTRL